MEPVFILHATQISKRLIVIQGVKPLLDVVTGHLETLDQHSKKLAGRLIDNDLSMFRDEDHLPCITLQNSAGGKFIHVYLGEKK